MASGGVLLIQCAHGEIITDQPRVKETLELTVGIKWSERGIGAWLDSLRDSSFRRVLLCQPPMMSLACHWSWRDMRAQGRGIAKLPDFPDDSFSLPTIYRQTGVFCGDIFNAMKAGDGTVFR